MPDTEEQTLETTETNPSSGTDNEEQTFGWFADDTQSDDQQGDEGDADDAQSGTDDEEGGEGQGDAAVDDGQGQGDADEEISEPSLLAKLVAAFTEARQQPAPAPAAPAPAQRQAVPVQFSMTDEELNRIADEHGADVPTMKAALAISQQLVGQALGQYLPMAMGDKRADDLKAFFQQEGFADADVQPYLRELDNLGVDALAWAQTPPHVREMFLSKSAYAASKVVRQQQEQAAKAQAKIAPKTPAATAATAASSAARTADADPTSHPEYQASVEFLMGMGMPRKDAEQNAKDYIAAEMAERKKTGRK